MDSATVTRVLTEEVRTNVRLRRELGMEEGTPSEAIRDSEVEGLVIHTTEGQIFAIGVQEL